MSSTTKQDFITPSGDSALELAEKIQNGSVTATQCVEDSYKTIAKTDEKIGAFNSLTKALALETAAKIDAQVKKGDKLPLLAGVPIAVKDNINVKGFPLTCSSKMLEGYVSPYNATVTEKLLSHGLPIVGKTNLDEFAMGSSTENSATKTTRNPWDTDRVPGGSSGGSAATVSAHQTPLSLGSDTGGSVRQPASLCGLVGVKPTYGLVSRFGLVAFGSSLDQVSPFARNVKDAAATLQVIAGFDKSDSTSLDSGELDFLSGIDNDIKGLKIGVINELNGEGMQTEVSESFQKSLDTFKTLGATIHDIAMPTIPYGVAAYYVIGASEASSNLARFDGVRYGYRAPESENETLNTMYKKTRATGFGSEVIRRIMLGTFSLSSGYYDAYYGKAQKVRELLRREFKQAWQDVDVLVCPTSPTTAFKIGEKSNDPVSMYLADISTIPVSLAGVPAINVPCGFDNNNLPIGLQLIAPHMGEQKLFQVAQAFEGASGLFNLSPSFN